MMSSSDVVEVIGWIEDAGIAVWIDGGWGVDALVGEQTRRHDDLDVVIDVEQVEESITILSALGFLMHLDRRPTSFIMRDEHDRRVDFHPVRFDAEGGWQALPNAPDFLYPHEGLTGIGTIAGRSVRCVSAGFQPYTHLGYDPDASDVHDMHLLRDRLGVRLPSPYDE